MKPHIQKLPLSEQSSFVADKFITPYFETPWHYHLAYELVLIIQGKGQRFVGNHISDFEEGQLDFLGSNLPHWYRKEYPNTTAGSIVIHFRDDFLGKDFLQIPEMQKIGLLFEKSKAGLHITGETQILISKKMEEMLTLSGIDRLVCLLSLLKTLSESTEYELLSSSELNKPKDKNNDRLEKTFSYVMDNFKNNIKIEEVAAIAMMSPSGFCRYFKNITKKNFTHFVNEIRIGYACKRFMEGDTHVSFVCYNSGFNSLSHFNKQFKKIVKLSPGQFKQKYKI